MRDDDWVLRQLPVGMVEDDFLARFVRIFQHVENTVFHQIDSLPHLFDVSVAPLPMVRAIGAWIGIDWIDPSLPDGLQRRIVREYASRLLWRGTRYGLQGVLELVSGAPAVVTDSGGVYEEGQAPAFTPHVRMEVQSTGWATEKDLIRIVQSEVPASVTFEIVVAGRTIWPPSPPDVGGGDVREIVEVS